MFVVIPVTTSAHDQKAVDEVLAWVLIPVGVKHTIAGEAEQEHDVSGEPLWGLKRCS